MTASADQPSLRQQVFSWLEDDEPELTPAQIEYNVAAGELFQLGAYGHFTYWPSGIGQAPSEWMDALHAAQNRFEAAVLGLIQPELDQLRARLDAVQQFIDRDQDGICCSHAQGQLRQILAAVPVQGA